MQCLLVCCLKKACNFFNFERFNMFMHPYNGIDLIVVSHMS